MKSIKTKYCTQDLLNGFPCDELGDDAQPVSPSSVVYHEPDFNVHIVAILGFKTNLDLKIVRAKLVDSLLRNPRFSSLQVMDENDHRKLKWVKTEVNLEEHVQEITTNRENVKPDKFIEDYVLNLTQTPLPKSKPLWDIHIINLKTKEAEAIAILRVHHSLGDGSSLISLLLACTRQTSNPEALPTIPTSRNQTKMKQIGVWGFLTLLFISVVDVFIFIMTVLFLKDTRTSLTSSPGVEFTRRRMVWRILNLDDMKLIKNHLNATVNDVALGITQAGFSRYLNTKYEKISRMESDESTEERSSLPKNIRFRTALLMNLRPSGIKKMAEMMEENSDAKYGNGAGFVLLPINICLHDDPLEYIREAKVTADRKKQSFEAILTSKLAELVLKIFGSKWESKLFHFAVSHTTGSFSNLVGPLEEVSFFGHEVAFVAAGCYGLPQGIMIQFVSYVNKMTMAISVDETTVPDADELCDEIEESLELIKDAVLKNANKMK